MTIPSHKKQVEIKVPSKIYLQIKNDDGSDNPEITWCEDRINDSDIVYYRRKKEV